MIRITDLRKEFVSERRGARVRAVDGVSFTVPQGRFFTLLGPSGCGKTTILRCVAGLERPTSGTVEIGGTVVASDSAFVPPNGRDIGMVFQSYAVWPHLTVFENVAFPLRVRKGRLGKADLARKVSDALELVGLGGMERRKPSQLSGGQQQRLSLARALVPEPECLLFDEPLSNLDAKLRERMRLELSSIQRTLGFTALYVTHDQVEALALSDEIAVMHEGRVVQRGAPKEIYFHPRSRRVAEFVGSTNVLPGKVLARGGDDRSVQVETSIGTLWCSGAVGDAAAGREVLVAFRPEDVELMRSQADTGGRNALEGNVEAVTFAGPSVDVDVTLLPEGRLRVQAGSRLELQVGDRVRLAVDPAACSILPFEGADVPAPQGAAAQETMA